MAEPNTVEPETFGQNALMYSENGVFHNNLNISTENERRNARNVIYSIIIVCFSSFFFGLCVSSSDFFITNFNETVMISKNVSFMDDQMINITDNSMDTQMMDTMDNPIGNQIMKTADNSTEKYNVTHMNDFIGNYTSMETIFALTTNEESWFRSILLLGAFFGNIGISSFHLNRKLVIVINNFLYIFGAISMYYSTHAAPFIIGEFIVGVASGISFAYVPAYLTEFKIYEMAGSIGSFQFVLVTLGVELGYLLEIYFKNYRSLGFLFIYIFMLAHSVSLIFVLDTQSTRNSKNIKSLFENRYSWKSVIICCIFHLAQQASGINILLICAPIILQNNTFAIKNRPACVGLSQLVANIFAMSLVDILGRKPLMILSVAGVIASLSIITFSQLIELGMYIFMIFFSLGLGPITWFITGELVPLEYRDATNQIATSMNWLSAFIAVRTQDYLFKALGTSMFTIHLFFMCIYLIYLIIFFKETKGRIPSFL